MKEATTATQSCLTLEESLRLELGKREICTIDDINQLQTISLLLWQINLETTERFHDTTNKLFTFMESRPWLIKWLEKMWLAYRK